MKRIDPRIACFGAALMTFAPAFAQKPGAHVHGIATLQVAIDGALLKLDFDSPLHDLVGFEHAPRTEAQKAAVRSMADRLEKGATQFVPAPEAGCTLASAKLSSPVFGNSGTPAGKADSAKQPASASKAAPRVPGSDGKKETHAALEGAYVFRCERPDRLNNLELKPEIAWSVPLSLGDSHRGFAVLGTSRAYFDHFRYGDARNQWHAAFHETCCRDYHALPP